MSLYFLVGYFASLSALMLSVSIKTQFYTQIFSAFERSPIVSFLAAVPFVLLLGIFVNLVRLAVTGTLIRRRTYQFDALPEAFLEALKLSIATQLSINEDQVDLRNDRHFETTKQLLLPETDEYEIRARWLHDLFENMLLVGCFSVIVVAFRALVFNLGGMDWALLIGNGVVGVFAAASIPYFRRAYTISESSLVVNKHKSRSLNWSPHGDDVQGEEKN